MRRSTVQGGDSNVALRDSARGVLLWEVHRCCCLSNCMHALCFVNANPACGRCDCCSIAHIGHHNAVTKLYKAPNLVSTPNADHGNSHVQEALNRGLLPDDNTLRQLSIEPDSIVHGRSLESMQWPDADLRMVLIRKLPCLLTTLVSSSEQASLIVSPVGVLPFVQSTFPLPPLGSTIYIVVISTVHHVFHIFHAADLLPVHICTSGRVGHSLVCLMWLSSSYAPSTLEEHRQSCQKIIVTAGHYYRHCCWYYFHHCCYC
jgi:hypothetical protein